ncbi:MAG: PA14 domain-containing protein [Desulfurococcaceae archaeon]
MLHLIICKLVKIKSGLMNGLRMVFYLWDTPDPPSETTGLTPVVETISPRVEYIWPGKPHEKVRAERFMAEFTGFIHVKKPGFYRFYVISSDGVLFWLDGNLLINAWHDTPPRLYMSGEIRLDQGYHRARLLYYNRHPFGQVTLGWIKPDKTSEVIPGENLFFTIGEHVFITNIPDNYRVSFIPLREELGPKTCISVNNICMVRIPYNEQPYECLVSIYDDKNTVTAKLTEPFLIWGGDVFEYIVEKR